MTRAVRTEGGPDDASPAEVVARETMLQGSLALVGRRRRSRSQKHDARSVASGLSIICLVLGLILGLVLLGRAVSPPGPAYSWTWDLVPEYIPFLLEGLKITVVLTVVTVLIGGVLGVAVAAARMSALPPLGTVTTFYIEVMRGTPLLVQLVWVYYCLPIVTGIELPAIASVLVALILNMGAFYGEAFRAGLQSIPVQEVESASILGLSYWQQMRYVKVPQAFRVILPVLMSLSVSLFKDTSLVAIVGLPDLMYNGLSVSTSTYRPLEMLSTVALIYFLVAFPVSALLRRLEVYLLRNQ